MASGSRSSPTIPLSERATADGERFSLLIVAEGVAETHELPESGELVIGRGEASDIVIDDPSLSRRHAGLRIAGAIVELRDLGSSNGTSLRGVRLAPDAPQPISAGEVAELGSVVVALQRVRPAPQPARPRSHAYFEAHLEDECARASRLGGAFAVAHVLATADPAKLAAVTSPGDVLATYAPGEYELLVLGAPEDLGRRLAATPGVGAVGVATYPRDGRDAQTLLHAARAAAGDRAPAPRTTTPVIAGVLLERIAASHVNVLILGETGVGKGVVAEEIHRRSPRAGRPFLRLNVAALSESLVESELFGHERGAFTGAHATKPGLLETAEGGTVLLDEVGELSPAIQAKLLRVLEDREVLRLGGLKPRVIDVRFLAATNRDLERAAAEGTFRADLYYRLAGVTLVVPPLRERRAEIGALARRFAAAHELDDDALRLLEAHAWPGNIRELKNMMERAALLSADGVITAEHLPVERMRPAAPSPSASPIAEAGGGGDERARIQEALDRCHGNQTEAAAQLGVARRTLVRRMAALGISGPRRKR
jgi:hypothetical protein